MSTARRPRAGFTLVEMLVVIAIIGILAAMLLAVFPAVVTSGKKARAKTEAQSLATAVQQYFSSYGRFPVSPQAQAAASAAGSDFTYGGTFQKPDGTPYQLGTLPGTSSLTNSEVIAILMDITSYPNGSGPTVNSGFVKNPQQTLFLNAKMSGWDPSQGGTPQPGVGNDLVYRDPWGNPYIITMDLNYDEHCQDVFYGLQTVSQQSGSTGYNGLVNTTDTSGNGDDFRYHGKVMVWSAGPDGKVDPTVKANQGANQDNVLSWQ